ncbi:hypothetical protein Leryth_002021 [Lithospermum erythrorhizon]|nr:hypothetical protein Leryth_002021 [Lithospermum erythrorhizon]
MMLAMTHYLPKFNLTSQQDAEEAFIHLLSSLREELSDSYLPEQSSLADVTTLPDCRILSAKSTVRESEHERWKRSVLGPFNGILGSSLTCQSCSFQISLDYQLFHSLHLPPVVAGRSEIVSGCFVEDCLKRFFAAEKLENYFCNHCWHVAAIKYLLLSPGNEVDVKKLKICREEETCDCRNISSLGSFPWLKNLSHTFKQLHIARSPKILCLHLQRASMNMFGEMVKLQGHISFPLVLDLAPFLKNGLGSKTQEQMLLNDLNKQKFNPTHTSSYVNMPQPQPHLDSGIGQREMEIDDGRIQYGCTNNSSEQCLNSNGTGEDRAFMHYGAKGQAGETSMGHMEHHRYLLVSVVQHYGRVGHGHYTVYRKVTGKSSIEDPVGLLESNFAQWFCISDSEVYSISEEEVLNAEASLLFYEKIS